MSKNEIALVGQGGDQLPAYMKDSAGLGNENVGVEDMEIPRLKLLQKMSDEVDKNHEAYVTDADAGDFYITILDRLVKGPLYAISVSYKESFDVWRKREAGGGVFLGSFENLSEANLTIGEQENPNEWEAVQTHNHMLLIKDPETGALSTPVLTQMSVSKLKVSRNWNSQISMRGGDRFATLWEISPASVQNKSGQTYYNMTVRPKGWVTEDDYKHAREVYQSITPADAE